MMEDSSTIGGKIVRPILSVFLGPTVRPCSRTPRRPGTRDNGKPSVRHSPVLDQAPANDLRLAPSPPKRACPDRRGYGPVLELHLNREGVRRRWVSGGTEGAAFGIGVGEVGGRGGVHTNGEKGRVHAPIGRTVNQRAWESEARADQPSDRCPAGCPMKMLGRAIGTRYRIRRVAARGRRQVDAAGELRHRPQALFRPAQPREAVRSR